VDAYAAIEQNRLKYLRLNKKKLHAYLYQGFKMPSLQVTIMLLPSDKGSFCHLLS
jgi:hypothetical protein